MRRRPLTERQILEWADAFQVRVGRWPNRNDRNRGLPDSTWYAIDQCLKAGHRGLSKGSSLASLLLRVRQRRHKGRLPKLTVARILDWADAHFRQVGVWPTKGSGAVIASPGEFWAAIDAALGLSGRGLPGGTTLAWLLNEERGVPHPLAVPRLTPKTILGWADSHRSRSGEWPTRNSGLVTEAPEETWLALDSALTQGHRGLAGGSSLARLLAAERDVRSVGDLPKLDEAAILAWADDWRRRTRSWPVAGSGTIPEAKGETWSSINSALILGLRGCPGGDSLAKLLTRHRGKRNPSALPPLTRDQILAWADSHRARTGEWPTRVSGLIPESSGETWRAVDKALLTGGRGLRTKSSLAKLLRKRRAPNGSKCTDSSVDSPC